jgi:hypothetical protein
MEKNPTTDDPQKLERGYQIFILVFFSGKLLSAAILITRRLDFLIRIVKYKC